MKKILVVNDVADCGRSYGYPFRDFAPCTNDLNLIHEDPDSILAAVFTGGSDVDPSLYGHSKYLGTFSDLRRDLQEQTICKRLIRLGVPLFGICRGSQFLCVMAGGTLVQHLNHHGGVLHDMLILGEDRTVEVNSTHHQMQVPPSDAVVIGVAEPRLSKQYIYDGRVGFNPDYEYEVVCYPSINALGAQYHPEVMSNKSDGWNYYRELIKKHLEEDLV